MNKLIKNQDQQVSMTAINMFNMKAVVDALVYGHPDMEFSVALDENTVIPLQSVLVTKDKKHVILADPITAKILKDTGKVKMVFKAMTDDEKRKALGE